MCALRWLSNPYEGPTFEPLISKRLSARFLHYEENPNKYSFLITCGEGKRERDIFLGARLRRRNGARWLRQRGGDVLPLCGI
jgi:hypothetical protein